MAETFKRKVVKLNDWTLSHLLSPGRHRYRIVRDGLPKDCHIINARFDFDDMLVLLVESETFDPVPKGEPYPELVPIINDLDAQLE